MTIRDNQGVSIGVGTCGSGRCGDLHSSVSRSVRRDHRTALSPPGCAAWLLWEFPLVSEVPSHSAFWTSDLSRSCRFSLRPPDLLGTPRRKLPTTDPHRCANQPPTARLAPQPPTNSTPACLAATTWASAQMGSAAGHWGPASGWEGPTCSRSWTKS